MVVAVGKALEAGARALICASTGNTSASAAAYGAAAGLEVVVVLPRGQIAAGQAPPGPGRRRPGRGDRGQLRPGPARRPRAGRVGRAIRSPWSTRSTRSASTARRPAHSRSATTWAGRPDVLAIPVGNAGNISAYWAGFGDYQAAGLAGTLPRMFGFQAAGAAPIVLDRRVEAPETIATAIRIGDPASWTKAIARPGRVGRPDRGGDRRPDPGGLARPRPRARASSASRRRRPAWPGSSAWPPRIGSSVTLRSCAC